MSVDSNINSKVLQNLVLDVDSSDDDTTSFSNTDTPSLPGTSYRNKEETNSSSKHHGKSSVCSPRKKMKQQISDELKPPKAETRATPRRVQYNNSHASIQKSSDGQSSRACEQHTFLTDITEVRQMEEGLLKLLDDFHSGKLQAFGKDCTFEKMEQVREQQEKLARLHFELNIQQEIYRPQSGDVRRVGRDNLGKLINNLQHLSRSIEQLQISSPSLQTDV